MTDPIVAAAYLLLMGQPAHAAVPTPPRPVPCQLTMSMSPAPVQGTHHVTPERAAPNHGNHVSVRWIGFHHAPPPPPRHRHHHHRP